MNQIKILIHNNSFDTVEEFLKYTRRTEMKNDKVEVVEIDKNDKVEVVESFLLDE